MNFRLISRIVGILLLLVAVAMFACALFAWLDVVAGDGGAAIAMFQASGVTALGGGVLLAAGGTGLALKHLPRREAVVIVGMGWILCCVFGSLPFMLCAPRLSFPMALFEATSGMTTTGGTVIADLTQWPRGILLWRAVTNWLGGIGILVLFVVVLSHAGVGGKTLFMNESSFRGGEAGEARVKDNSLLLLRVYLLLTASCMIGLRMMGLSWFNALAHACSAISTGGFSPHNASVGYYASWGNGALIEVWLGVFMMASGLNFIVYVLASKRKWAQVRAQEDGIWFISLGLGSSLLIAAGVAACDGQPFLQAWRGSFFVVASAISCCGFGTVNYDLWPAFAKILLAALMIIGGCAGSTSGGIKVGRFVVFVKTSLHEIVRAFRPNQVYSLRICGRPLGNDACKQVMVFISMYGFIIIGSTLMVGLLELGTGISMETCIGAVLACISNVGPGFDAVGPATNFSALRPVTHLFLSWLMILGRLELFALLVLFLPRAWRRY